MPLSMPPPALSDPLRLLCVLLPLFCMLFALAHIAGTAILHQALEDGGLQATTGVSDTLPRTHYSPLGMSLHLPMSLLPS